MINCEVNIILIWSGNCALTDMRTQTIIPAERSNPSSPAINATTEATLWITDTKLYLPVVTLSNQDNTKLLQQLRIAFKYTIK